MADRHGPCTLDAQKRPLDILERPLDAQKRPLGILGRRYGGRYGGRGCIVSRLYIKQKVFSVGEKFTVFGESEQPRYYVQGSFMRVPKRFTVTDGAGAPVAEITKTAFSLLPRFTVEMQGVEVATIRKELSFKPKYFIEGAALDVSGDWWDMNFDVSRSGQRVASIRKKWLSWGDTYEVDIFDDALEAIIISLVVAIDRVRADAASSSAATM